MIVFLLTFWDSYSLPKAQGISQVLVATCQLSGFIPVGNKDKAKQREGGEVSEREGNRNHEQQYFFLVVIFLLVCGFAGRWVVKFAEVPSL